MKVDKEKIEEIHHNIAEHKKEDAEKHHGQYSTYYRDSIVTKHPLNPWTDKEWYRAGTTSALASMSSWLNGASETMMQYNIAALAAVSSHDPVTSPVAIPDEQISGVFGSQDQGAAL